MQLSKENLEVSLKLMWEIKSSFVGFSLIIIKWSAGKNITTIEAKENIFFFIFLLDNETFAIYKLLKFCIVFIIFALFIFDKLY